jgi:hypothetical protein
LDSVQAVPHGPRWIKLTPEIITQFRKPGKQSPKNRLSGD